MKVEFTREEIEAIAALQPFSVCPWCGDMPTDHAPADCTRRPKPNAATEGARLMRWKSTEPLNGSCHVVNCKREWEMRLAPSCSHVLGGLERRICDEHWKEYCALANTPTPQAERHHTGGREKVE